MGEHRKYFRHEQGGEWCPEMADENNEGGLSDARSWHLSRLILDDKDDDWTFEPTRLNVCALSCDLEGTTVTHNPHEVGAPVPAEAELFSQPGFGGMQFADTSVVYPKEPYFLLHRGDRYELPETLRKLAIRQGRERHGATLYRLSMPTKWTPELESWITRSRLVASRIPRLRWQVESDLASPEDFEGDTFSALFSGPETGSHHVSIFMKAPITAQWSVVAWIDSVSFPLPKRFIDVVCRYNLRPRGHLYVRAESDLALDGDWREPEWIGSQSEKWRSFIVHVGDGFAIRGQVSITT
jgi:hypothetical protein